MSDKQSKNETKSINALRLKNVSLDLHAATCEKKLSFLFLWPLQQMILLVSNSIFFEEVVSKIQITCFRMFSLVKE